MGTQHIFDAYLPTGRQRTDKMRGVLDTRRSKGPLPAKITAKWPFGGSLDPQVHDQPV